MYKNIKKIILVISLISFAFFVVSVIYNFINKKSIVENKELKTISSDKEINKPLLNDTQIINEDLDVYEQRQLRADYNNGSPY